MSNTTQENKPATATPAAIAQACHPMHHLGRDLRNAVANVESCVRDYDSHHAETRDFARRALATNAAAVLGHAEDVAANLPALRAVISGEPAHAVLDLGSSILVRYRPPTNSRAAKWLATYWRDNSLTFRASSHFTYDDKDKDGADLAAAACLAKFTAYCNDGPGDSPAISHRLRGRASLGNGEYAYTFSR